MRSNFRPTAARTINIPECIHIGAGRVHQPGAVAAPCRSLRPGDVLEVAPLHVDRRLVRPEPVRRPNEMEVAHAAVAGAIADAHLAAARSSGVAAHHPPGIVLPAGDARPAPIGREVPIDGVGSLAMHANRRFRPVGRARVRVVPLAVMELAARDRAEVQIGGDVRPVPALLADAILVDDIDRAKIRLEPVVLGVPAAAERRLIGRHVPGLPNTLPSTGRFLSASRPGAAKRASKLARSARRATL